MSILDQTYFDKQGTKMYNNPNKNAYQQDTLAKRSPLEETLDITYKAIEELTNRIDLLANKLSPICLPMISPTNNDESVPAGSPMVNRMRSHLCMLDKLNQDINCILSSLEV